MQGLIRNPLADPGLVGVGARAGPEAVLAIVLGGLLPVSIARVIGLHLVPFAAFLGGWAAPLPLFAVSSRKGRMSVACVPGCDLRRAAAVHAAGLSVSGGRGREAGADGGRVGT